MWLYNEKWKFYYYAPRNYKRERRGYVYGRVEYKCPAFIVNSRAFFNGSLYGFIGSSVITYHQNS